MGSNFFHQEESNLLSWMLSIFIKYKYHDTRNVWKVLQLSLIVIIQQQKTTKFLIIFVTMFTKYRRMWMLIINYHMWLTVVRVHITLEKVIWSNFRFSSQKQRGRVRNSLKTFKTILFSLSGHSNNFGKTFTATLKSVSEKFSEKTVSVSSKSALKWQPTLFYDIWTNILLQGLILYFSPILEK